MLRELSQGHSTIVGPWGDVIATTEHSPDVVRLQLLTMRPLQSVITKCAPIILKHVLGCSIAESVANRRSPAEHSCNQSKETRPVFRSSQTGKLPPSVLCRLVYPHKAPNDCILPTARSQARWRTVMRVSAALAGAVMGYFTLRALLPGPVVSSASTGDSKQ